MPPVAVAVAAVLSSRAVDLDALAARAQRGAVVLADARLVRRVIKRHRHVKGFGLEVPHARCYSIGRDALLAIVSAGELGTTEASLPEVVALVAAPDRAELRTRDEGATIEAVWRAAFHAEIHRAVEGRLRSGELSPARLRARVHAIGETEFDEARLVLRDDRLLLPPYDDASTYAEFAAVYLELERFAPLLLEKTFPTLGDPARVRSVLAEDVDAAALFEATRPTDAPPPRATVATSSEAPNVSSLPLPSSLERSSIEELVGGADVARSRGNVVRSALLRLGAVALEGEPGALAAAKNDLAGLAARLAVAVGASEEVARKEWTPALLAIAERAIARKKLYRTVEARLLYDVQRACLASEAPLHVIDLVEAIRSLFRRPIVRELPATSPFRVLTALRSAEAKVRHLRANPSERAAISRVLGEALQRAEHRLRETLRPAIERVMVPVGLVPANLPERVALSKVADELLDAIAERGHVGLGDLRDALARNQLKMKDLSAKDLLVGDALLRANRRLALEIDGVYRRGEAYLRLLQKLSSITFGTSIGRFLTRYLILPAGSAFVLLKGVSEIASLVLHVVTHPPPHHHHEIDLATPIAVPALSVVLFALIHFAWARHVARLLLAGVGFGIAGLFFRAPLWVVSRPSVRAILASRAARGLYGLIMKPLLFATVLILLTPLRHAQRSSQIAGVFALALPIAALLNSRQGVLAGEIAGDYLIRQWQTLTTRLAPGLARLIVEIFARFLAFLERGIYAVDELLRFRRGEHPVALVVKAVTGFFWFFVAYVVRALVVLMIEPQVNPIKHFPVVTVSAKIIYPLYPTIHPALLAAISPFSATVAHLVSGPLIFLLPGLSGFLVWELSSNWREYAATRAPCLEPARIGHHGETMGALMRPGFHSGTLPKLYARMRRAAKRGDPSLAKHQATLAGIVEAVTRFAERELVVLLRASAFSKGASLEVHRVELASNRVRVTFACAEEPPFAIQFDEQSGLLVASVARVGFVAKLDAADRTLFENALAGLYARADVDLVREQLDAILEGAPYDVADEGLVVWPHAAFNTEVVYDLDATDAILPPLVRGEAIDEPPPALDAAKAIFRRAPIAWSAWVAAWSEGAPPARIASGPSLLPKPA